MRTTKKYTSNMRQPHYTKAYSPMLIKLFNQYALHTVKKTNNISESHLNSHRYWLQKYHSPGDLPWPMSKQESKVCLCNEIIENAVYIYRQTLVFIPTKTQRWFGTISPSQYEYWSRTPSVTHIIWLIRIIKVPRYCRRQCQWWMLCTVP